MGSTSSSVRLYIYVPSHVWLKYRWMWLNQSCSLTSTAYYWPSTGTGDLELFFIILFEDRFSVTEHSGKLQKILYRVNLCLRKMLFNSLAKQIKGPYEPVLLYYRMLCSKCRSHTVVKSQWTKSPPPPKKKKKKKKKNQKTKTKSDIKMI